MNQIETMTLNELKIAFYDLTREMDILQAQSVAFNQTRNMVAQRINEIIEVTESMQFLQAEEPAQLEEMDLHDMDEKVTA
jgi:hypothetical protein